MQKASKAIFILQDTEGKVIDEPQFGAPPCKRCGAGHACQRDSKYYRGPEDEEEPEESAAIHDSTTRRQDNRRCKKEGKGADGSGEEDEDGESPPAVVEARPAGGVAEEQGAPKKLPEWLVDGARIKFVNEGDKLWWGALVRAHPVDGFIFGVDDGDFTFVSSARAAVMAGAGEIERLGETAGGLCPV